MKTWDLIGRHAHAQLDHAINGLALPAKKVKRLKDMAMTLFMEARDDGIKMAAEIARAYDKMSSHPYLPSDCIAMKLNAVPGKPRVNKEARKKKRDQEKFDTKADAILTDIEQKLSRIEANQRFLLGVAKFQKKKGR